MTTHVIMIVDMSGSMWDVQEDVRGGFNAYLDELQADVINDYRITTTVFDTRFINLDVNTPIVDAKRLDASNYRPGGFTALLDAVGKTLAEFWIRVTELAEGDRGIIVIQTDGHENASKEYSYESVKLALTALQEEAGWGVIYLAAGPDSWDQASQMGVARAQYLNTSGSNEAYVGTYSGLGKGVRKFSQGGTAQSVVDYMEEETRGK